MPANRPAGEVLTLLPTTTITTAVTASLSTPIVGLAGRGSLHVQATFVYGSAGTTVKAWLQSSLDGGVTWFDVASFAFTTSSLVRAAALTIRASLSGLVTLTDGTLADNTIVNGVLGDRLRVKRTTTGTYAGGTTLKIVGLVRD